MYINYEYTQTIEVFFLRDTVCNVSTMSEGTHVFFSFRSCVFANRKSQKGTEARRFPRLSAFSANIFRNNYSGL